MHLYNFGQVSKIMLLVVITDLKYGFYTNISLQQLISLSRKETCIKQRKHVETMLWKFFL